ncbi:hypothetical protein AVEN_73979-1 [Araneus ventricosus]|uniref:Uncharacterized protein n=1 Tax=Araneus ventricosus TaxID=182803 RepID=A0A4Y2W911_ARAVE|nr:hypothetical protein AVEN_12204-1 [Araneus ventricosus]GBO33482.1 hypothetical protein AVEN_73979-1 [Araneus ventricosus]
MTDDSCAFIVLSSPLRMSKVDSARRTKLLPQASLSFDVRFNLHQAYQQGESLSWAFISTPFHSICPNSWFVFQSFQSKNLGKSFTDVPKFVLIHLV